MPWYYAGPEAKPVGPVSLEELHARRLNGSISPETYVIEHEHAGQASNQFAWKRYREIFSHTPGLPPISQPSTHFSLPPVPPVTTAPVLPPVAPPPPQPHPLFPSAASPAVHQPGISPVARPDPYYDFKPTNSWCAWGFGLSLGGLFFTVFACGLGVFLALPAFFICIYAWIQVQHNSAQSGKGLAIAGALISGFSLLIFFVIALAIAIPAFKAHNLTVTEQSTNDTQ